MKYLSLILSISVFLLSVIPSCIEDKCLSLHKQSIEKESVGTQSENSCDDCADNNCCSPFLHCNTCSGFPEARYTNPIKVATNLVSGCTSKYIVRGNSLDFISSIWQPPQA